MTYLKQLIERDIKRMEDYLDSAQREYTDYFQRAHEALDDQKKYCEQLKELYAALRKLET